MGCRGAGVQPGLQEVLMFWLSEESLNLFLVCMLEAARGPGNLQGSVGQPKPHGKAPEKA